MQSAYNPKQVEQEVLEYWESRGIYGKVKQASSGREKFYFFDGPPYASGSIHMGTAWNKVLKDAYIRFWRMLGYDVWDQPGYDTHGTPIEYQVEKQLGFRNKKDIEAHGVKDFIAKCREFATKYILLMNSQFANLGVWLDWQKPYLTLDNRYIEGAWFTFKKAFEKGFLYKDRYSVHVCPRCETAVSYNEIEHRKLSDPSIYVKFQVSGKPDEFLLIWTTTPWTLPSNTGIMAHPDFDYAYVEAGNEVLVIAKELVDKVMEKAGASGYKIRKVVKGKALEGVQYAHPLRDLVPGLQTVRNAHRVVLSSRYVTLEDGTGLVHTAPGHGLEDYLVGKETGLPMLSPVNEDGTFSKDAGEWLAGKFVKSADKEIMEMLEERGALLRRDTIVHEYPVCWRCSTPLLQLSMPQWFFRVTAIRDKLIEFNEGVDWTPKWARQRFRDWLENLGDWPVSRQRYWGIPLPIWECACGHIEVIGSFEELKRKSTLKSDLYQQDKAGRQQEIDFHRPGIDGVAIRCAKCGKDVRRISDVLDVWFDAGVATWASIGYPREKELFERMWPADLQIEGPDQFRGWWNAEIITSTMAFGKPPFERILLHGFVLDAKGVKMSKSKGNIVSPDDVLARYGRDIMRLYLLNSAPWDDFYFNWEAVAEVNKVFNILWNTYVFVKTYSDKSLYSSHSSLPKHLQPEDRWIISRANSVAKQAEESGRSCQLHSAFKGASDFLLNDFSRWYIKIIRNRVSPWHSGEDKAGAQYALLYVLDRVLKMLAPAVPLLTEKVYLDLYHEKESIHMTAWPKPEAMDEALEGQMERIKGILEAISSARNEQKVKLRWPLSDVSVELNNHEDESAVKHLENIIKTLGNVKEIRISKGLKEAKEFPFGKVRLGEVLKDDAFLRELTRQVQSLRKEAGYDVREKIVLELHAGKETEERIRSMEDELKTATGAGKIVFGAVRHARGRSGFEGEEVEIGFERGE
ncbi:MAG: isoleucine--tRNA ligase [Candidatus Aenigmarchaeota archaeon]|nr:isoleucine--tRNA ligase [Candidatus Aenigmarchaeota archaeon]